jgi:hypothetical protein
MALLSYMPAKCPHELMLEWVQIGAMEVPERVKKGIREEIVSTFRASSHMSMLMTCVDPSGAAQSRSASRCYEVWTISH